MESVLGRVMSPPHFPITPPSCGASGASGLDPGDHEIEGFSVLALEIRTRAGRTFGFRAPTAPPTLTYMSDHCHPLAGTGARWAGGVPRRRHGPGPAPTSSSTTPSTPTRNCRPGASFGHSCPGYAVGLALAAGAKRLVLFHHDPQRTDDEIDAMVAGYQDARRPGRGGDRGLPIDLRPS